MTKKTLLAIALLVVGVLCLSRNLGWIDGWGYWWPVMLIRWWPAILIVLGGWLLFKARTPRA